MDDNTRAIYDAELKEMKRMTNKFAEDGDQGYTGEPLSKIVGKDPSIGYPRTVFVDECVCIGC